MNVNWKKKDAEYVPSGCIKITIKYIKLYRDETKLGIPSFGPNTNKRMSRTILARKLRTDPDSGNTYIMTKEMNFSVGSGSMFKSRFWIIGKNGQFGYLDSGRGTMVQHLKFHQPKDVQGRAKEIKEKNVPYCFWGESRVRWEKAQTRL